MIRRPPRSTPLYSSAASDVYKRQPSASAVLQCAGSHAGHLPRLSPRLPSPSPSSSDCASIVSSGPALAGPLYCLGQCCHLHGSRPLDRLTHLIGRQLRLLDTGELCRMLWSIRPRRAERLLAQWLSPPKAQRPRSGVPSPAMAVQPIDQVHSVIPQKTPTGGRLTSRGYVEDLCLAASLSTVFPLAAYAIAKIYQPARAVQ